MPGHQSVVPCSRSRRLQGAALLVVLLAIATGCMQRGVVAKSVVAMDPYAQLPAEERVTVYQESLAVTAADPVLHFRLGNAYYDLHQLSRAVEEFQKAVALDSTFSNAWGNLGTALEEQDDLDGALRAYRKGVDLAPNDAAAWSNLGSVYYAKAQHTDAVSAYRESLRLDPKNVQALYNMGVAFADARIYKEALRYWQQVLAIAPASEAGKNAQTNIALLQSLRQSEENRKAAAERAAKKPDGAPGDSAAPAAPAAPPAHTPH